MFKNKYFVGIEREGLKCTKDGYLANTKNSEIFKNTFIGTDFGMSQLELRTPVCESTAECYDKLENITDIVVNELEKEKSYNYLKDFILSVSQKNKPHLN